MKNTQKIQDRMAGMIAYAVKQIAGDPGKNFVLVCETIIEKEDIKKSIPAEASGRIEVSLIGSLQAFNWTSLKPAGANLKTEYLIDPALIEARLAAPLKMLREFPETQPEAPATDTGDNSETPPPATDESPATPPETPAPEKPAPSKKPAKPKA